MGDGSRKNPGGPERMNILKALSKQLFGARYESAIRSLAVCLILFLAVHTAGIRMEIAPSILFLTATASSAGIMWQALHFSGNEDCMAGLFMLPFANREMNFAFILAFAGYTLLTKTFPVLALFFAVHEWSVLQIAVALLCACNGCFMAAAGYVMTKQRKPFLMLLHADAYVFYRPVSAKPLSRRHQGTGSVLLYLLRYLITNKNYLANTAGLCVVGGILPMILEPFEGMNVMPLGFAILCLNTPICILLTCDSSLEQAVRVLPGQAGRFCLRYGFGIFAVNMAVSSVYLAAWQIQRGKVGGMEIMTAVLFALQSAILSALLEWFYPIRNWKIESDLWQHPRKYIVPLIMFFIAGIIGMWSVSIWFLLCIVIVEFLSLLFIVRRI